MTRDGAPIIGETELVERAARDAAAYQPVDERDDPLAASRGIAVAAVTMLPFWALVALAWWFAS